MEKERKVRGHYCIAHYWLYCIGEEEPGLSLNPHGFGQVLRILLFCTGEWLLRDLSPVGGPA